MTNSRRKSRLIQPQTISIKSPETRFGELEARIARLEKALRQRFDDYGFAELPEELGPPPNKRGPKVKLSLEEHLWRRDYLIEKTESHWPELQLLFKKCKNVESLMIGLNEFVTDRYAHWALQMIDDADLVFEFVKGPNYHGNPRNLADAISGLPELGLYRSQRICRDHPSKLPVGERALRDYLRRKHPHKFPELRRARTVQKIMEIMQNTRTKDPVYLTLAKSPALVLELLKAGRANAN